MNRIYANSRYRSVTKSPFRADSLKKSRVDKRDPRASKLNHRTARFGERLPYSMIDLGVGTIRRTTIFSRSRSSPTRGLIFSFHSSLS